MNYFIGMAWKKNFGGIPKSKKDTQYILTEMCDVCGKDCVAPIPRFSYMSQSGVVYVIRHHTNCDPYIALRRIGAVCDD